MKKMTPRQITFIVVILVLTIINLKDFTFDGLISAFVVGFLSTLVSFFAIDYWKTL